MMRWTLIFMCLLDVPKPFLLQTSQSCVLALHRLALKHHESRALLTTEHSLTQHT